MKTLAYVGRAYPHIQRLKQIKDLGYKLVLLRDPNYAVKDVVIFDNIIELDFSSIDAFVQSLEIIKDTIDIDGLLCEYENYIIYKAAAAQTLTLPALSLESALACTDKYSMRQKFLSYDEAITPRFIKVSNIDELLEFAQSAGYPIILKPTNLVKSLLVTKCDSETELVAAYEETASKIKGLYEKLHISSRQPGIIAEQFINGKLCSVAAYVDAEGIPHFCDGLVELTSAREAGYDDSFLYSRKLRDTSTDSVRSDIIDVATKGVKALSMRSTPAHIEIIYNDHRAQLVEIGARIGGYRPWMYHESYGIDLIEQEVRVALGQSPSFQSSFASYSAVYELFPDVDGVYESLKNFHSGAYDYCSLPYKPGEIIGKAQNGYRATAIIGVLAQTKDDFERKCKEVERISVKTK